MGLANVVKSENASRLCFVNPCRHFIHDRLERNIRDWKFRSTEDEAAKKSEANAAWHLEQGVKTIHGVKATEPSCETHASTSAQHGKRIHERRVADQVQYCIDLLSFSD